MPPTAAIISFRLGGADGVAVEARKWEGALRALGFEFRRVAGAIEDAGQPGDVELPWLALDAGAADVAAHDAAHDAARDAELRDALGSADLIVVENLCSLPINLAAARSVARVLGEGGRRVVFHHHDLPSQRRAYASYAGEFPPRILGALHVTINLRSRRELESHGYGPVVAMHNRFDLDAPPGDREATRAQFGFGTDALVVLQPSRAIERKNVPGGVRFTSELARALPDRPVRYWLSGPAEDGYEPVLERILGRATVPVTVGRAPRAADAYAAADVLVLPSTWEGFGNPTIESIVARRPLAVFAYPVLAEIRATGLRFFSTSDVPALARFLREPEGVRANFYDVNLRRAALSYSLAELPAELDALFRRMGWSW